MRIPALFHLIPIKRDKKPPPLVDGPADLLQGEFRGQGRRFLLLCGLFIGGPPYVICAAFLDGDRVLEQGTVMERQGRGFPAFVVSAGFFFSIPGSGGRYKEGRVLQSPAGPLARRGGLC